MSVSHSINLFTLKPLTKTPTLRRNFPIRASVYNPNKCRIQRNILAFPSKNGVPSSLHDAASDTHVVKTVSDISGLTKITDKKKEIVEMVKGTGFGAKATKEMNVEVLEMIVMLEGKSLSPLPLVDGKWILIYTSYPQMLALLRPLTLLENLKVNYEITLNVHSLTSTVENSVKFTGPRLKLTLGANTNFDVPSLEHLQISFIEGVIGIPQLFHGIMIPESLQIFGQQINISSLKSVMIVGDNTKFDVLKHFQGITSIPESFSGITIPENLQLFGHQINISSFKDVLTLGSNIKFDLPILEHVKMSFMEGVIGIPQLFHSIKMPENLQLFGQQINTKFDALNLKHFQVSFIEGVISIPQNFSGITIPQNLQLFGQQVDISSLKSVMTVGANTKFDLLVLKHILMSFIEGVKGITIPENLKLFGQQVNISPLKDAVASVENAVSSFANMY